MIQTTSQPPLRPGPNRTPWRQVLDRISLPTLRKIVIAILGGSVLLIGVAMILLPGPAILVIPLGLAILATEFLWAKRMLARIRARFSKIPQPGVSPDPASSHHSADESPEPKAGTAAVDALPARMTDSPRP